MKIKIEKHGNKKNENKSLFYHSKHSLQTDKNSSNNTEESERHESIQLIRGLHYLSYQLISQCHFHFTPECLHAFIQIMNGFGYHAKNKNT